MVHAAATHRHMPFGPCWVPGLRAILCIVKNFTNKGVPALDALDGFALLLVDDHPLFRDGLAAALRHQAPGLRVQAVGSPAEALELLMSDGEGFDLVLLGMGEKFELWSEQAHHAQIRQTLSDDQIAWVIDAYTRGVVADEQMSALAMAIFLNGMVNRRGEEFSSFIKADLETGRLSYSRTPDGFDQREEFKIPAKVWDVELTRKQRADLQSGKAVLVEGIKGYDGKTISQYVKANFNQGRLDFYNENPDRRRDASQRNVVSATQRQGEENRQSRGASIA